MARAVRRREKRQACSLIQTSAENVGRQITASSDHSGRRGPVGDQVRIGHVAFREGMARKVVD